MQNIDQTKVKWRHMTIDWKSGSDRICKIGTYTNGYVGKGVFLKQNVCKIVQLPFAINIFAGHFEVQRWLVHGQVTIIFVVSVCLFVCLSVCLFVQSFFSAVFDPIWIKLGHMLDVRV